MKMAVAQKSAISVGMLYIAADLYKTTRDISISFNQLCKDSHERVKYKKYCPSCNKEIKNDDIIKGYEFEKGRYITFTQDELEKLKTEKDNTLHIEHTAKMADIDSIFFDKNYYLIPEPGAEKSYELFRQALLSQKLVAVARTVLGTKQELLVLYPTKECIIAKILFYEEEIQALPKPIPKVEIKKDELDLAKLMVKSLERKFDIAAYHDEYQQRLREAITTKINGQEIVAIDNTRPNNIINIMDAMKQVVEMSKNTQNNKAGNM